MNYEDIKEEIVAIAEIAASVPEQFRDKCFEVLLENLLKENEEPVSTQDPENNNKKENAIPPSPTGGGSLEPTSKIKAFIRRQGLSIEQLEEMVMIEGDEFHFLKEPSHGNARKGQMEWALLLTLKNGFIQNSFVADPEDVRSLVQDKGYYDQGNFAKNFKQEKPKSHFKGLLERQGDPQELSNEGEKALAALIKELLGG